MSPGLRIGLLGGSFNPAHSGHRYASALALKSLGLDYVWWLVSPQNPLKSENGMASLEQRLASARRHARHPRIIVTSLEQSLGTRYTIDTLRALRRRFPQLRFVWLMGSDNLIQFPHWRDWQDIFALAPVAIVGRPGSAQLARNSKAAQRFRADFRAPSPAFGRASPPAWTMLDGRRDPASATAIRSRLPSPG